ncbi:MAG: hypothetical protein ABI461_15670 [Polyangiaceae bacterium]
MRKPLFLASAVLSLAACASHPVPKTALAPEIPMYSQAEWAQMNTDSSVPQLTPNSVEAYSLSSSQSGGSYLPVLQRGRSFGWSNGGSGGSGAVTGGGSSFAGAPARGSTMLSSSSSGGHVAMSGSGSHGHR